MLVGGVTTVGADLMDTNVMEDDFHRICPELIRAVEIMQEIDVQNIVSLLTDEQVAYFEKALAMRREQMRTH